MSAAQETQAARDEFADLYGRWVDGPAGVGIRPADWACDGPELVAAVQPSLFAGLDEEAK